MVLLNQAKSRFDVLITMDSGMSHQRNLAETELALILLRARSNRLADTLPLMPIVLAKLDDVKPGSVITIAK